MFPSNLHRLPRGINQHTSIYHCIQAALRFLAFASFSLQLRLHIYGVWAYLALASRAIWALGGGFGMEAHNS